MIRHKPLDARMRIVRLRELERRLYSYVNAYLAELENRKAANGRSNNAAIHARSWQQILDAMFSILVQEGEVEVIEEEGDAVDELD